MKILLQNFTTFILRGQRYYLDEIYAVDSRSFIVLFNILLNFAWSVVLIFQGDADGYDLVVVDAMHKANYASRICHSCRPNCEAK